MLTDLEKEILKTTIWDNPFIPKDHMPFPKQLDALLDFRKELLFGGSAGGGKGSTDSDFILTSTGKILVSDIKIGDEILNPDGTNQTVLDVYPLGEQDIYQITFEDGATCGVTLDHLWLTITEFGTELLQTTRQMISNLPVYIPSLTSPNPRKILSINNIGKNTCRCIKVSNPNGLYVVNDDIITHNSDFLLMAALQFVEQPNYNAIIFRRTYSDLSLPDGLIPRSHEWLTGTPARYKPDLHQWVFPSGSTITFGYLESEKDVYRYKSSQFTFCVAKGTPVLMEDNTYKNIEDVSVNDVIMTLNGPKRILKTYGSRIDDCVKLHTINKKGEIIGSQIHPITHEFLTPYGWFSYASIYNLFCSGEPKLCHTSHKLSLQPPQKYQYPWQTCAHLRDELLHLEPSESLQDRPQNGENDACLRGAQIDNTMTSHAYLETRMLPSLCVPVVLHVPDPQSHKKFLSEDRYATFDAQTDSLSQDYQVNCSAYQNLCDEQAHLVLNTVQYDLPSLNNAVLPYPDYYDMDDQDYIPKYTHPHLLTYTHPYTMDNQNSSEVVQLGSCILSPCGKHIVYDISVEDVSHYITSTHIVNKNCGFEELTEFPSERFYTYLFSRMRKLADCAIPLRMRATTNPDGPGAEWVYERFKPDDPQPLPDGRRFLSSKLYDNPHIDQDSYIENLAETDPVTRMQLQEGIWRVKKSGNKFKQEWFDRCYINPSEVPEEGITVRYWDFAATEIKKGVKQTDPDYTVGTKVRLHRNIYYIMDVRRDRLAPGKLEEFIRDTAEFDGPETIIYLEQEPGASGKIMIDDYIRRVLNGYAVFGDRSTGPKEARANVFSAALYNGMVRLVRAPWNKPFVTECCLFPTKGVHDDQVDATSGAISKLPRAKRWKNGNIGEVSMFNPMAGELTFDTDLEIEELNLEEFM